MLFSWRLIATLSFGVCLEEGEDARVTAKDVAAKKEVFRKSFQITQRKKTGRDIEKSVFLKRFKDKPDILKRAKWISVRVRYEKTKQKWWCNR